MPYTPSPRRWSSATATRHAPKLNRSPTADRRRALELLAASRDGYTEALMLAHGFTVELMVELVNAGLASVTTERVVAGGLKMEVARCGSPRDGGRWRIAPSSDAQ